MYPQMLASAILTLLAAVPLALPSNTLAQTAAQNSAKGDEVLLDMGQAFKRADRKKLTALLPQAQGHALEAWAAYWELKARLEDASAPEVQDFFKRYAGTYQEDRLRNDWLLLLGQRRDWGNFAAEHPNYRMGDDREVRCYALLVDHLRLGASAPASLPAEVLKNWLAQRDADDGCTLAADRLYSAQKLSSAHVWRKARLAMEANRPRAARDAVAIVLPEAGALVSELNANPAKFVALKAANTKLRKELLLLAIIKMASNDPDAAAGAMGKSQLAQLSNEERNWAWGSIGKQAAQRLSDDALAYFAHAPDSGLSDEMLAWKTRAALRAATGAATGPSKAPDWAQVLKATAAMGEDVQREPTWVYWRARALLATASTAPERAEATRMLEGMASPRGFYEMLALEELGEKISLPPRPAPLLPEEQESARLNAGLNRAVYAISIGLRSEGVREWNYSTNLAKPGGMSERELLAAAQFACSHAVWDRCINTSERTKTEFDAAQRFPTPFKDQVLQRTAQIGLDPAYVYGLIRQESRFVMDARSGVGASGLMQVMPATARWTAKKIGLANFSADQLNDRETNIAIGTGYLKLVLDDLGGSMPLAAAAYNAGPGRPRAWRNGPVLEAAAWAENIPFAETRDYVKKVLANTTLYAALLTGQPQSLKARLGTVGPRAAAAPEANTELP